MGTSLKTIDPKMLERIQALRLIDDDFMTVVFDGDKKLTQFLLRILLERDDLFVKSVMTQKEKRNLYGRSVKLDILAVDSNGKNYDVEVQRADEGASPRRVRYNQAMLDSHTLKKMQKFTDLPELYIIFITENDYYGLGFPYYAVEKRIKKADLPFDDGCNIIYVNGSYRGDDPLGKLMHDFCTPDADEMNYSEIAERVRYHKQQDGGKKNMCRIIEEYGDEREAEGRQKTAIANAKNMLNDAVPVEHIAKWTSLPLEQVLALKKELEQQEETAF
ncbi:PD-(D/E)XK nuclease family transposase [Treponema ruminis]|uniref:PD-(D/E)XK nuclease family transposase n=1 Tax=Treponema ruminis TaxID=744515 RepID=A0A7W8G9I5_9SPIR|nr:PD-(D/E)XK nuclease family transposase [Treponema ruminis]MBB5226287.1 hypothetical protein [Treponema ruminis]